MGIFTAGADRLQLVLYDAGVMIVRSSLWFLRIDPRNLGGLRVSAMGQVAVYSVPGAHFSVDGGVTWTEAPASLYLADVSFVSSSLIYGLTDGGLEKSTDGGKSWKTLLYPYDYILQ